MMESSDRYHKNFLLGSTAKALLELQDENPSNFSDEDIVKHLKMKYEELGLTASNPLEERLKNQ